MKEDLSLAHCNKCKKQTQHTGMEDKRTNKLLLVCDTCKDTNYEFDMGE